MYKERAWSPNKFGQVHNRGVKSLFSDRKSLLKGINQQGKPTYVKL